MTDARCDVDAGRLWSSLMAMAEIGKTPAGGVRRLALSDEDRRARDVLVRWLEEARLRRSRRRCRQHLRPPSGYGCRRGAGGIRLAPRHRADGRKFDGVLGVVGAVEVIRALNDAGIQTRRPLEVVDWTNEEGAWFPPAMLASGVVFGRFTLEEAYAARNPEGRTFGDDLRRIGYCGDPAHRLSEAAAYLELHVEQGPVLERAGVQIGVVEGVEGISWNHVEIIGAEAHAGPTPDRRSAGHARCGGADHCVPSGDGRSVSGPQDDGGPY